MVWFELFSSSLFFLLNFHLHLVLESKTHFFNTLYTDETNSQRGWWSILEIPYFTDIFFGSLPPILTFIPVSRLIGLSVCHEFKLPSLISEPCFTDVFMCYFYCETIIYGDCLSIYIQVFERGWKKERCFIFIAVQPWCLLGNFVVLLGNFKIQTIVWPWKSLKSEKNTKMITFLPWYSRFKTVFKFEIRPEKRPVKLFTLRTPISSL